MNDAPQRALVIGLGKSGIAVCEVLRERRWEVLATDQSPERVPEAIAHVAALGVPFVSTDALREALRGDEIAVLSPGVPPSALPVAIAWGKGCTVLGEVEIAARFARAPILGVTGTKGKSTTSALLAHLLRAAGKKTALGGNIGAPLIREVLPDGLDAIVAELSSFQLESIDRFHPRVAVLLNLSPDHLDRHGDMAGYIAAKRAIFARREAADWAVIGIDDDDSRALADSLSGPGIVRISGANRDGADIRLEGGRLRDQDGVLADLSQARALPGAHNAQNAAAAAALARALAVPRAAIAAGIASYPGLPHRAERIADIAGVLFINDSKATNAASAARALACHERIVWIAGGIAKAGGIASLAPLFPRVSEALLIGRDAPQFAETLARHGVAHRLVGTLAAAVPAAFAAARAEGAVVLLSPASASFDQFANFEARGEAFRALVAALADGEGR